MTRPRAQWKGHLKLDEITCQVALYSGASTAERTRFHTVNKDTGNRVRREFVDEKSGKPVERDDQVKGYETDQGDFVILEQEEIDAAIPESDKTIRIEAFIPCREVDTVYFDKPYYLAPVDKVAEEAFDLIREGMKKKKVAALGEAILFRRVRKLMIRPFGNGVVANTLNFDYEVRSAKEAFDDIPAVKIKKDMLDLAGHIIGTMAGNFDPSSFDDRYDAALAELVRAKIEGRPIKAPKKSKPGKVVDLMEALRESAKIADRQPRKSAGKRPGSGKKAA
ncbi:Ku protein [Mesorhizobium sp. J428]|uniref:non-homologous end joining protein Ku n=1 Tax=Mesorhizobium sp. J428 TaxID=2898440 RepID=UPI0021516DF3|nr:Ku protein [Mesorhizobium sp. J428]MCR5858625.1 Ku protein [Mesorhizobium sp. J428]